MFFKLLLKYSCFTVLLISAVQPSLPATRTHTSTLFLGFLPFQSRWNTVLCGRSSSVSVVYIVSRVYLYQSQCPNSSFSIMLSFSWPGETPAYHYGTHYSSAMIVASYLVRMEPFTQIFLRLQVKLF